MISDEKVELLLDLAAAGKSIRAMAKIVGVAKQTAQNYQQAYKCLKEEEENKGGNKMVIDLYNSEKSPCFGCHQHRDKNHEDCVSCDLRIKYMNVFNLPESKLKSDSDRAEILTPPPSLKPVNTKICRGPLCKKINPKGIVHPLETFGKNRREKDGLQKWCKKCQTDSVTRSKQKKTGKGTAAQPVAIITFRSRDDIFKETLKKMEELKTFHQKELEKIDIAILAIKNVNI